MFGASSGAGGGAGAGGATAVSKKGRLVPWVEKHRPKSMKDIAFQEEVVRTLETAIRTGNFPHLLFYGPPGTGKTSTITAVCRELFGTSMLSKRVKELNASDDRGIDVIRNTVKLFAQTAVGSSTGTGKYPCPPFKIIILDEADSLTIEAQTALRRTMETYSKVTRFCLICNYVSRIIDPIASRCAKFRFKPLAQRAMRTRLQHIAEAESLTVTEEAYDTLVELAGGDLRKAITTMQSTASFYGSEILPDDVVEMSGVPPKTVCDTLWASITTKRFDDVQQDVEDLVASGYAMSELLDRLTDAVLTGDELSDAQKGRMFEALAACDKCLTDGADEALQLMALAQRLNRIARKMKLSCDAERA